MLHGETLAKQHSEQSVSSKDNSLNSISLQAQNSCCFNTTTQEMLILLSWKAALG